MANEINAFELTDEQLDMVAGGRTTNTNTFTTNLAQALSISADTTNTFIVANTGKKGGAGATAHQSGATITGIVLLGNASITH